MKRELKTAWLGALRSGNYQQGKEVLRDREDKFCCLGVLCDLMQKQGKGEWSNDEGYWEFVYGEMHNGEIIPINLAVELGLRYNTDYDKDKYKTATYDPHTMQYYAKLNDGETEYDFNVDEEVVVTAPKSFAEIADEIEKNIPEED